MKWVLIGLVVALVGTNAWWLYTSVDHGVSDMYRMQTCTEHEEALAQSLAVVGWRKDARLAESSWKRLVRHCRNSGNRSRRMAR